MVLRRGPRLPGLRPLGQRWAGRQQEAPGHVCFRHLPVSPSAGRKCPACLALAPSPCGPLFHAQQIPAFSVPAVPADPQNPVSVLSYSWAMRTPGWIVDLRALFCPRRPECRQGCDVSPTGPPPRLSATWLTSSGKDDMVWYGHHLLGAQLRGLRGQEGREGWEARPGRQTEGSSRVQNWVTGPTSPRGKALQTGKWPQKGGTQGDPARFPAPCPQPAPSRRTLWDLVGSPCPTVVAGAQHCECAKFTQWCSALPTHPAFSWAACCRCTEAARL